MSPESRVETYAAIRRDAHVACQEGNFNADTARYGARARPTGVGLACAHGVVPATGVHARSLLAARWILAVPTVRTARQTATHE